VSDVSILTASRSAVTARVPAEWTNGATSCATAERTERSLLVVNEALVVTCSVSMIWFSVEAC
jgi:hypothetical protein